jgi:tetratricopeptide (TPR) repeat protein
LFAWWKIGIGVAFLGIAVALAVGAPWWYRYHLGEAEKAANEGRYDQGLSHVERCAALWTRSPRLCRVAARIQRRRGDFLEAQAWLERCKSLPDGVTDSTQLEWILLRAERDDVNEVADGLWKSVQAGHSESPRILEALAAAYMRQARYLPARNCLDRWLEIEPDAVLALDWRSWLHDRLDVRDLATADCRRALEIDPDRTAIRLRLAQFLVDGHYYSEAMPHFQKVRDREADNLEAPVGLGICSFKQGHAAKARQYLNDVLAMDPNHPNALLARAKLELEDNKPAEAEKYFRRLLAIRPHDMEALYHLAQSLRQQSGREKEEKKIRSLWEKTKAEGERLINLLRKKDADLADPALRSEIGRLFLNRGEDRLGLLWLYRALELNESHQPTHEALAAYYEKVKNEEKAAEHRRLANAKVPSASGEQ